jgi:hypothetical protein
MRTLIVLLSFHLYGATPSIPDAQSLLERSDAVRNGGYSFAVRVNIRNFEDGKVDEEHAYQVFQKGLDKSYVEFLSPREKGRHLLMLGDDMWVFLPDTSRPIRITPLERLSGEASNGDVARTHYALDYDATYLRSETVNGVACDVLELNAKRRGATYRKIHYWLNASNARPVKAEYFLASGKHLKSATFDEFRQVQGQTVLRRLTIYDQVRKGSHSVMEYGDFVARDLPDRMFHQGRER